ncbi:hypothetical protein PRIPAC_82525 [Pristionchus pacificus]|uniref:Uncharacterized protein n=1 Tax=Pristionchus pacificus TaxID=54126 RepID=A0A2A6CMW9_PRIPA|nr:hypothetical protein PRIPAC_82525 [Pristionchus pacificus]|eukprot:PDM79544.1 hypothetical protein PRIPAC_32123 [Pristionchus pacificus]
MIGESPIRLGYGFLSPPGSAEFSGGIRGYDIDAFNDFTLAIGPTIPHDEERSPFTGVLGSIENGSIFAYLDQNELTPNRVRAFEWILSQMVEFDLYSGFVSDELEDPSLRNFIVFTTSTFALIIALVSIIHLPFIKYGLRSGSVSLVAIMGNTVKNHNREFLLGDPSRLIVNDDFNEIVDLLCTPSKKYLAAMTSFDFALLPDPKGRCELANSDRWKTAEKKIRKSWLKKLKWLYNTHYSWENRLGILHRRYNNGRPSQLMRGDEKTVPTFTPLTLIRMSSVLYAYLILISLSIAVFIVEISLPMPRVTRWVKRYDIDAFSDFARAIVIRLEFVQLESTATIPHDQERSLFTGVPGAIENGSIISYLDQNALTPIRVKSFEYILNQMLGFDLYGGRIPDVQRDSSPTRFVANFFLLYSVLLIFFFHDDSDLEKSAGLSTTVKCDDQYFLLGDPSQLFVIADPSEVAIRLCSPTKKIHLASSQFIQLPKPRSGCVLGKDSGSCIYGTVIVDCRKRMTRLISSLFLVLSHSTIFCNLLIPRFYPSFNNCFIAELTFPAAKAMRLIRKIKFPCLRIHSSTNIIH